MVCCFGPRLEAVEEKLKDSELSSQKQLNESRNKLEAAVVSTSVDRTALTRLV